MGQNPELRAQNSEARVGISVCGDRERRKEECPFISIARSREKTTPCCGVHDHIFSGGLAFIRPSLSLFLYRSICTQPGFLVGLQVCVWVALLYLAATGLRTRLGGQQQLSLSSPHWGPLLYSPTPTPLPLRDYIHLSHPPHLTPLFIL